MKKSCFLLSAVLGLALFCNGCVLLLVGGAAAAGAGAVAYHDGQLDASEAVSLAKARSTTLAALRDMNYGIVGDDTSPVKNVIVARTGNDTKITVTLEKLSDTVTKIRVRVGVFGDEALSGRIMERIKSRL